jgi:hypothetical protein
MTLEKKLFQLLNAIIDFCGDGWPYMETLFGKREREKPKLLNDYGDIYISVIKYTKPRFDANSGFVTNRLR